VLRPRSSTNQSAMADSKKLDLLNFWRDKRAPASDSQHPASAAISPNSSLRNFADVVALFDIPNLTAPSSEKKEHATHLVALHAAQAAIDHIENLTLDSEITREALLELWHRVTAHVSDPWEDLRASVFKFIQACVRFQHRPLGQELSVLSSLRPVFFDFLFQHAGDELLVTRTLEKLVEHSALPFERWLPTLVGRLMQNDSSSIEASALAQKLIKQGFFGTFEDTGISICCAAASIPLRLNCPISADQPLESHFLELIKNVLQYRFLPPRVLPLLVTRLCCSVHSELLWEPVTELLRSMLLRRGNLNVVNCMLEILENSAEYAATCDAEWQQLLDSYTASSTKLPLGCTFYDQLRSINHMSLFSSAIVIRGCVFFLSMFTWGPLKLEQLKLPCVVILPSFVAALPDPKAAFEKMAVVTEVVLSIKRLVSKYGSQLYFEWEHIFAIIRKISMTLPWKFEGAPFSAFMDTVKFMIKMYENGTPLFSGDSLIDEIENFLAYVPQDIQVKCLSHRTNRAHPSFPDWQAQLQRFCDVYLLSVPQYQVKGIALDAIRQFIDLFGALYPEDVTSAVVPSLLDLCCGSTPAHVFDTAGISNLHHEAVQCLLDLAVLLKDIRHFALVMSHIEAVATRKGTFLQFEMTLDSVRRAEGVRDSLTDTETFAMQGTLGVFHAVFSDKDPDRLLYLWDMYKKWLNHGWGPLRVFTLAVCQLISVSDDGRPRLLSSYIVMSSNSVKASETDSDHHGIVQSFTTRLFPWNSSAPVVENGSDKVFDVSWLFNACIKCMNIYASRSDGFSQQVTILAVQVLMVGISSTFIFDSCDVVPVAVSLCRWLLPQPTLGFDTFSQCPPFFSSSLCRNLSVSAEDGMQVEFEFLIYDLLCAVALRLATNIESGKHSSLPSSDMNAVFQSCCAALIYGAGCGCRAIPDAVWSLSISVSTYTQTLITDALHIASDIQVDDSLSSMSTGAGVAAACNFAVLIASAPNLVITFWPHFLSVMRLYLSTVLGIPENGLQTTSRVQISPVPGCTLSISLLRQILNVLRIAIRVIPHVCAHHPDIPFILGLAMNDVRVGTVVSHFSHSLIIEWYNCCVSLSQKDHHYAASGQVQAALSAALGAVQPFASRDHGGTDVPISAATLEALICSSRGTMKPAVHSQAQFYFIIGEAIWSAVPLPDGGVFLVIRRGAGCFSWTVSPTVAVPRYLPFALLQSESNHGSCNDMSSSTNNCDETLPPTSSHMPAIKVSDDSLILLNDTLTSSASFSHAAEHRTLVHAPQSVSLATNSLDEVTLQFRSAHNQKVNAPNPSSPIIKPHPLSPLITSQSSAVTVGRGRTRLNTSPSIQPLSFNKVSMSTLDSLRGPLRSSDADASASKIDAFMDPSDNSDGVPTIPNLSVGQPIIPAVQVDIVTSSASTLDSLSPAQGQFSESGKCGSSSPANHLLPESAVSSFRDTEQFVLSQGNDQFRLSTGTEPSRLSSGSAAEAIGSNPFTAHVDSHLAQSSSSSSALAARSDSGSAPNSPHSALPRLSYSFNQQSLITSPLKQQLMNHDQDVLPFHTDETKLSDELSIPVFSEGVVVPSSANADVVHVLQHPVFDNRAYSVRSDRSSSLHSLPSYDDDTCGVDLIAPNFTCVLDEAHVASHDSHISNPSSSNLNDSHILDAIPRSPRSILISGGGQQSDNARDRSHGTSWWRPGKDLWRKKNLQRLVTQLGAPLPIGSLSSFGQLETFRAVVLDHRRSTTPASASIPLQPPISERKSPLPRGQSAFNPSTESSSSMAHSPLQESPNTSPSLKTSPSKSLNTCTDVGAASGAAINDNSPSRAASASSNASAEHVANGFVGNQAPMIVGESSSLDHESSSSKPDNLNASNRSKASQWLHVIMQLIPPPISGSNSVETLCTSDSSTASAMNILDKTPACECARVALIFRGSDGSSTAPSSRFMQFVYGLGRLVPLASAAAHDIFTGGLDTSGSRHGSWALHCSSASAQAVFYVPSLIQLERGCSLDSATKQSIDGLVGNCYVTIIYTENEFEIAERSHLLVGDFHWLVITVQPVSCGRNRVFGRMKPGYPQLSIFGPTAKIVSDDALPALLQVQTIHSFSFLFFCHLDASNFSALS
jgi:hypothetical protein